jgi:hypothetical protein
MLLLHYHTVRVIGKLCPGRRIFDSVVVSNHLEAPRRQGQPQSYNFQVFSTALKIQKLTDKE